MNTEIAVIASSNILETDPSLLGFLAGAQKIVDENFKNFPNSIARGMGVKLEVEAGPRYMRIVRKDTQHGVWQKGFACGAHCFVDRTNGDVLKAASWKTPAKGARGNIFDAHNGLGRMGPYGTHYNR